LISVELSGPCKYTDKRQNCKEREYYGEEDQKPPLSRLIFDGSP